LGAILSFRARNPDQRSNLIASKVVILPEFDWATATKVASEDQIRRRIKLARAVLGSGCDKAAIEGSVRVVVVKQAKWVSYRPTQQKKDAVARVAAALHRLDVALDNASSFPSHLRNRFPRAELSRLRFQCEKLGYEPLPAPRKDVYDKRIAVAEAAYLLFELDRPLTLTRTGEFCRLAAAIYGDKDADMFDLCRAFKNRHKTRSRL
jgi:hypothetical protein